MPSIPSELVAIREGAGIPPDELLELVGRKSAAEGLAGHKDQLAGKGQAGLPCNLQVISQRALFVQTWVSTLCQLAEQLVLQKQGATEKRPIVHLDTTDSASLSRSSQPTSVGCYPGDSSVIALGKKALPTGENLNLLEHNSLDSRSSRSSISIH
ncbi:hypothetical protein PGT21_001951 [Puccinia graminis f. sp. tritici]|uniref:Uncharacterized protein n=1 Tax=Puccinia graminis f. sp. tritici TaxID=56615 RepID=A0A5B0MLV4_PUCGR|nr:hypothetical protein PGTUg99_001437 [Puccinia graminis f. sp. tritici]KAA1071278.1 hypothetical protein PGT21_002070 [Puccinia graminis f. sp. tritici]KAA1077283.1 hypothetical protein PGT21_001951 [Puccinia graminis f. sp. tritici]